MTPSLDATTRRADATSRVVRSRNPTGRTQESRGICDAYIIATATPGVASSLLFHRLMSTSVIRITKRMSSAGTTIVRCEGRLDAQALSELQAALPPSSLQDTQIDLAGVTSLDRTAREFLIHARDRGVQLVGGSLYINQLLEEASVVQLATDRPLSAPDLEAGLLNRLRLNEQAAFEELVRLTTGQLLGVARRMMSREEDAQDAVQEAYLGAFKSLDQFDGRSRLSTWLYRITINACLMKRRSTRRRPEQPLDALLPQFLEDGHQRDPGLPWKPMEERGIERSETLALVRSKIDELPEQFREVLMLRDIEGLDTEQSARFLNMSPAAVKTRLHRARQALRSLLDPHFT